MDPVQFNQIIEQECLLKPDRLVVVGFSGGPDSLCLLHMLKQAGYPLLAAHMNHQLRPEADQDERRVRQIAADAGIPVISRTEDVRRFASEHRLSIEEAARVVRYSWLFDVAREQQAQAVAVGHTGDDQAETVLMHFLRGAGLSGLAGMRYRSLFEEWDPAIPLVRPLLGMRREDTISYCNNKNLAPVIDASNADTTYFRNRLRHELIPYLQEFNPQINASIQRMSQILAGDSDLLDELTQKAWIKCLRTQGITYVVFSFADLQKSPRGLTRRLLRRAVQSLRPYLRDVDFSTIDRGVEFINHPTKSRRVDLQNGLRLALENDWLILSDVINLNLNEDYPQMEGDEAVTLQLPGSIQIGVKWRLSTDVDPISSDFVMKNPDHPFEAWVDAEKAGQSLTIRKRQPGDRFQPLGLVNGSVKISDFMVNEHMPRSARQNWPLVCTNGQILWLPGYRPDHTFRITAETRQVLHLKLDRIIAVTSG